MLKQALFALTAALCIILQAARAAPPPAAEIEINHLLGLIENSGCEFFRNGTWYDAQRAAAHLRDKYEALAANGRIETAEDFIDKAASRSSISSQAYLIKCGGGAPITTRQWFSAALARYRGASGAQRSGDRTEFPSVRSILPVGARRRAELLAKSAGEMTVIAEPATPGDFGNSKAIVSLVAQQPMRPMEPAGIHHTASPALALIQIPVFCCVAETGEWHRILPCRTPAIQV
jgi:hypothetical protein